MDKRKITLTVIAIAVLLVVLVGSTYAYWTLNGTPKTSANVQVQTGGLILRLDDTEGSITTNDVIDPNHLSFSKYFNITNESAADGYAKVLFKGLTNTFVTDALVYDLEEVQANKTSFSEPRMIITNEVVPKVSNANATLADGLLIEKGTLSGNTVTPNTKYYKITVRYKYSDTVNQNEDLNKTLVSGFTLEEGQPSVSMTISFNAGEKASSTPTSRTLAYGSTYGELPETQVNGDYFIEGWYTDNLYTEKVTEESKVLKSGNHTLYANWEKVVRCIDDNGKTMTCPQTLTIGQRVAVGNETFRYLRTTDTTSNSNECGTTSSIACTDTDSRNNIGENKLRLFAEYNLKRTGDATSATAISSDALQDLMDKKWNYGENWILSSNTIQFGSSSPNYNQSYLKEYLNNYVSILNSLIGKSNIIMSDVLRYPEIINLNWGCPAASYGACSNMPNWATNSGYWVGSAYDSVSVFCIGAGGFGYNKYNRSNNDGARPVIMISETDFNHYR